jgi:hypothetical protein
MNALADKGTVKTLTMHYIDGAFMESHGREVMDEVRPTDGQVIARVTLADEEDTRRAIAAANRAFTTYGRSTVEERAEILRRLHQAASARLDDLTAAMVEEYGGVVEFARPIVESAVNAFAAAEKARSSRTRRRRAVRRVKKVGNFHIFEAVVSRNAAQRKLIDDLLALFGGRSQPVVAHLIESGKLTLEDVKEAAKTLRKLTRKDKSQ